MSGGNEIDRLNRNIMMDVLRIIAMVMVLLVHIPIYIPLPYSFPNGQYGVAIFFVLSGYLIMESLEHTQSVKKFYQKRLIRILPEYYIILIIGIIIWDKLFRQMPTDNLLHLGWLRYFLCLNTILPSNDYYYWNDLWGLWTISCFMFFYLIAPLLKKITSNYKRSIYMLLISGVGCYGIKQILQSLLIKINIPQAELFSGDTPFFNLMIFMIGISTWYAVKEKKESIYLMLCIVVIAIMIFMEKSNRITWGLFAAAFIILGSKVQIKNEIFTKVIEKISAYSFTVYLVHFPVFQILGQMGMKNRTSVYYLSTAIVIIIFAAILIHNIAEKVIIANINRLIIRRS